MTRQAYRPQSSEEGQIWPATKEWIEQKYLVEGLNCVQIGEMVSRHPKSVWYRMKRFGIPTRARGADSGHRFLPGEQTRLGCGHTEESRDKIRQARLKDGRVPYLKDGVHHLKGKKGIDTPNWRGGTSPERALFYGTSEWKEAVKKVWKRDAACCRRCGYQQLKINRIKNKFAIHHILSFAFKQCRCSIENLVLLCRPCHLFVHSSANINREFLADDQFEIGLAWRRGLGIRHESA